MIFTGAGRGTKAVWIEEQVDRPVTKDLWSSPDLATQLNTLSLKDEPLFRLSGRSQFSCI